MDQTERKGGTVDPRVVRGWVLTGLGLAFVLWGVLHLSSASLGGRVERFEERRTYNEVKRSAHRALPGAVLRAGVGGLLLFLGARMRARAEEEGSGGGAQP